MCKCWLHIDGAVGGIYVERLQDDQHTSYVIVCLQHYHAVISGAILRLSRDVFSNIKKGPMRNTVYRLTPLSYRLHSSTRITMSLVYFATREEAYTSVKSNARVAIDFADRSKPLMHDTYGIAIQYPHYVVAARLTTLSPSPAHTASRWQQRCQRTQIIN